MNYSGSYINLFFLFELLILKMVMNVFKPNNYLNSFECKLIALIFFSD